MEEDLKTKAMIELRALRLLNFQRQVLHLMLSAHEKSRKFDKFCVFEKRTEQVIQLNQTFFLDDDSFN